MAQEGDETVIMKSYKPVVVGIVAIVALAWILFHLILIGMYEAVLIKETELWILSTEIIVTIGLIAVCIWTLIEYVRR